MSEIQHIDVHIAELRRQIINKIIEFKNIRKKSESTPDDENPNHWKELIQDMVKEAEEYNTHINFDFILDSLPDDLKRTFLWIGVNNKGIQTWNNDLIGLNFKDAIIRAIYNDPYNFIIYDSFEAVIETEFPEINIFEPISLETVNKVADKIIEHVKNSEVDEDSSEQIIVFDITDPTKNVEMIYPEFEKFIGIFKSARAKNIGMI